MSNSIEATRCPSCGQTKCPECDGQKLESALNHWKQESGFETPEEMIEAVTVRFKNELPKGLGRSLWLLEQLDRKKAEEALVQARTDIINLLANIDEMLKDEPVVEDVRKRWVSQYVCDCGAPSERKCEHGYCDSKDCRCLCHDKSLHEPPDTKSGPGDCMNFGTPEQLAGMSPPQPVYRYGKKIVLAAKDLSPNALESGATAELQCDEDMPEVNCGTFTDQPLSRAATIRRQQALIRTLRERVDSLLLEIGEATEANDAWADQDRKTARQMLVVTAERDAARFEAAQRLQQCLNQVDIDNRAIKEWERTLGEAVDFLRALLADKATTLQRENASSLIKGFDSRRKSGTTLVKYPTDKTGCLCGGVGCNSCEPQGRG
jgi:hypothetical protein